MKVKGKKETIMVWQFVIMRAFSVWQRLTLHSGALRVHSFSLDNVAGFSTGMAFPASSGPRKRVAGVPPMKPARSTRECGEVERPSVDVFGRFYFSANGMQPSVGRLRSCLIFIP